MGHKLKKIIATFNLVEVALAIGIVGVGMAAIMGLYPVALKACRNAVSENYSMSSAEQFLCLLEMQADIDWNSFISALPSSKPTPAQLTLPNDWSNNIVGDIYTTGTTLGAGVYGVMVKTGTVTDYAAHAVVWKTPLKSSYGANTPQFFTDSFYQNASSLNIEISWPVEIPYNARTKRVYSIILARKL